MSYFDELSDKYNRAREKQAKINKNLMDIEEKLNIETVDFETFEQVKELYKNLEETNSELVSTASEMLNEMEKYN